MSVGDVLGGIREVAPGSLLFIPVFMVLIFSTLGEVVFIDILSNLQKSCKNSTWDSLYYILSCMCVLYHFKFP